MNDDYYIAFDEYGTPYIAHMGPKYVMKVKEAGRALYFYTIEAYKKWLKNRQNKANKVNDKADNKSDSKDTLDKNSFNQKPIELPDDYEKRHVVDDSYKNLKQKRTTKKNNSR